MAIIKNGVKEYEGLVYRIWEHYWMDGMTEEFADVWDIEKHEVKSINIGYYGSDFRNLCGDVRAEVDLSAEAKRDILRTIKRGSAVSAYVNSVIRAKTEITAGTTAEVVRGRKVKKGTILNVFWVGERETYQSRKYYWMHETETIAGAYDEDGNKVWIKVEYLKNIDPIKSPCAAERKKFMKAYIKKTARDYGIYV